ncbi:site-2 protease family protein [Raineyella sp. LH-20]|uniref:site-2 protease family protein n=1 Tax=Raineyella sp. LH-20 TaxID=3081204 RepID=UPI002954FA86|nr:site-2 protease family protein [Raineyella sp. LH-20]WOP19559.1 site-2 protease family protein [Raineyella sp. LH-20]
MGTGIRLGRIAGIEIRLQWSVVVIFLLIAWSLATVQFTPTPGVGTTASWVAAVIAALLYFGALLAHELGHALLAQRKGLEVESITLWVFGGVSRLKGEAEGPADEFRIAVIGPVVSLAVAAVFAGAGYLLATLGAPTLAVDVARWLALINLLLGVFNLLPAFPLDGGRVLRAGLWRRSKDRASATRTAAAVGRAFGISFVAGGVFLFVAGAPVNGLWFALLGWFLFGAARAEESHVLLAGALRDVRVAQVMTGHPTVVPTDLAVQDYVEQAMASRFTSFPVVDRSGAVVGLVTMRRVRAAMAGGDQHATVGQVAIPLAQVPVLSPYDTATQLVDRLQQAPDGRALVFDGGHLVGIVSPTDLQRMLDLALLRPRGDR